MNSAIQISMKAFQSLMATLSPERALVVRGRHAVGKSEGVYQGAAMRRSDFYADSHNCQAMVKVLGPIGFKAARNKVSEWSYEMGLPVVERRLSQMTEGDLLGLPKLGEGGTKFVPPDWLLAACRFPCILFLDERNRALEAVKQAVFQILDSRTFYGYTLHQETLVVVAENIGSDYQVLPQDPAEISRGAVVELAPTQEEWLDYASKVVHPLLASFLRQNPNLIEHTGVHEPGKKYPDRRAWMALNEELTRAMLWDAPNNDLFYVMAGAFCGVEVAAQFQSFAIDNSRHVSAQDIVNSWDLAKSRLGGTMPMEMWADAVAKLGEFFASNDLTAEQAINVARFMYDAPAEVRMATWGKLQSRQQNLVAVHKHVKDLILATVTGQPTHNLMPPAAPTTVTTSSANGAGTSNTTSNTNVKRGRGRPRKNS